MCMCTIFVGTERVARRGIGRAAICGTLLSASAGGGGGGGGGLCSFCDGGGGGVLDVDLLVILL